MNKIKIHFKKENKILFYSSKIKYEFNRFCIPVYLVILNIMGVIIASKQADRIYMREGFNSSTNVGLCQVIIYDSLLEKHCVNYTFLKNLTVPGLYF